MVAAHEQHVLGDQWIHTHQHQANKLVSHLDSRPILCPVMAALYNEGDLKTDANGAIDTKTLFNALHGTLGQVSSLAWEQAIGITDFDEAHKETQDYRERCFPWSKCFYEQRLGIARANRFVNIFRMNGLEGIVITGNDQCSFSFH